MGEPAREKMFGDELGDPRVVREHPGEIQMRPPQTEIDRRRLGVHDKLRQVISRSEPGKDPISVPSPRNDFFSCDVRGEVPAVLLGILLDSTVQSMIVPA